MVVGSVFLFGSFLLSFVYLCCVCVLLVFLSSTHLYRRFYPYSRAHSLLYFSERCRHFCLWSRLLLLYLLLVFFPLVYYILSFCSLIVDLYTLLLNV